MGYNVLDEYAKPPPHRVDSWKNIRVRNYIESNRTEQRLISNQAIDSNFRHEPDW